MQIKFIFVWKTKSKDINALEMNYQKYISKYCKYSIDIVKEDKSSDVTKIKEIEWKRLLDRIKDDNFIVLLEVKWHYLSSEDFAKKIDSFKCSWISPIFIIAWPFWSSEALINRADLLLSFSKMTFTHEMMRPMLFEQVFRAFSILKGSSYHK